MGREDKYINNDFIKRFNHYCREITQNSWEDVCTKTRNKEEQTEQTGDKVAGSD